MNESSRSRKGRPSSAKPWPTSPSDNKIRVRLTKSVKWIPDEQRSECKICKLAFGVLKRKHHCRLCGEVVCGECSDSKVFLRNTRAFERSCDRCFESAVLAHEHLSEENTRKAQEGEDTDGDDRQRSSSPDSFEHIEVDEAPQRVGENSPPVPPPPSSTSTSPTPTTAPTPTLYVAAPASVTTTRRKLARTRLRRIFASSLLLVCVPVAMTATGFLTRKRGFGWGTWTALVIGLVYHRLTRAMQTVIAELQTLHQAQLLKLQEAHALAMKPVDKRQNDDNANVDMNDEHNADEKQAEEVDVGEPQLPDEYRDFILQKKEELLQAAHAKNNEDGWTLTDTVQGVERWTRANKENKPIVMGRGLVNGPVRACQDIIMSMVPSTTQRLDEMFERYTQVALLNNQTSIQHTLYKRQWPTSQRDFMVLLHWQVDASGRLIIVACTPPDEHPDAPAPPGVRGSVDVGGWVIEPRPGYRSHCTYMAAANLGGSLPSVILAKLAELQPLQVAKLNTVLKERDLELYKPGGARSAPRTNSDYAKISAEEEATLWKK